MVVAGGGDSRVLAMAIIFSGGRWEREGGWQWGVLDGLSGSFS